MRRSMNEQVREYKRRRRFRSRWTKLLGIMACVVVFCTTYALILPAITLESTTTCGLVEHSHGEDCYETILICPLEETDAVEQQVVTCGLEAGQGAHAHGDDCYQLVETLVCELEEGEEHTHTSECYTVERVLICQEEEQEGHVHSDACYETVTVDPGHHHTEECREKILTCEIPEHQHTEACAPVETETFTSGNWFTRVFGGVTVEVEAPVGAFPAGTEMNVSSAPREAVEAAADAVGVDTSSVKAVDITFTCDGEEVQPAVPISVKLTANLVKTAEEPVIVHVDDNANATVIADTEVENKTVTFEAESFSVYAIVAPDDTSGEDPRYIYEFYVAVDVTDENGEVTKTETKLVETQIITAGDTLTRPEVPDIPTRYSAFVGWYIGGTQNTTTGVWENGTSVTFGALDGTALADALTTYRATNEYDADKNADGNAENVKVIKVHARFADKVKVEFRVTQEDEYGNITYKADVDTKDVVRGGTVTINDVVATPPSSDLGFMGWSYTEKASDRIGNIIQGTSITVNSDTILYAVFEAGHTLKFVNGEGATHTTSQFVAAGNNTRRPGSDPTRPGYTFEGWYTGEVDEDGNVNYDTTPFTFGRPLSGDTTIYAKWTPNEGVNYTVVFWYENADNAEYSYAGYASKAGTAGNTISSSDFQNEAFDGRDATHFTYNSAKTETKTVAGDGSTVLNVYFTRNTYKLTFVSENGNTTYGTITAKYQAYIGDQWPTAGETMTGGTVALPTNTVGWSFTKVGESESISQATKVYTLTSEFCSPNGLTITAKTRDANELYTYIINYMMECLDENDADGIEWGDDNTLYKNDARYTQTLQYTNHTTWGYKEIEGFTRAQLDSASREGNEAPYTFNLYYKRNRNGITFNDNYGNVTATISDVMFEMPLSSLTYNGMSLSEIVPTYQGPGGAEYYEFKGWYTTPECIEGTKADFEKITMPNENLTFYAKWEPKTVTVTYDPNGGWFWEDTSGKPTTREIAYNTVAPELNMEGNNDEIYSFVAWNYTDEFGQVVPWNFDNPVTKDLTLTAEWYTDVAVSIVYKVKAVGDDGNETWKTDIVSDPGIYLDGANVLVLGYETEEDFVGWRLGVQSSSDTGYNELSGTFYTPGDFLTVSEAADLADGPDHDKQIVLYAVYYTPPTVDLTFNSNGGKFSVDEDDDLPGTIGNESTTYTLTGLVNNGGVDLDDIPTPTREGYTFKGWATVQTPGENDKVHIADGEDTREIYVDEIEPNILYAVWEKIPTVDLTIKKVDGDNLTKLLPGAEFTFTKTETVEGEETTYYYGMNGWQDEKATLTTGTEGTITLLELEDGKYTLTETKAPDGYNLPEGEIIITVNNGTASASTGTKLEEDAEVADSSTSEAAYTLTVPNSAGAALPNTGGTGTYFYTISGLLLMAVAVMYGYTLRRKRERGTED